jgi:uncharacterized protein (DUF2147 family)
MEMLAEMALKLLMKCLTERLLAKVMIVSAWEVAKRTKPTADDAIVKAVAEAWGVSTADLAPLSIEPTEIKAG